MISKELLAILPFDCIQASVTLILIKNINYISNHLYQIKFTHWDILSIFITKGLFKWHPKWCFNKTDMPCLYNVKVDSNYGDNYLSMLLFFFYAYT